MAAASPFGPDPMTTASGISFLDQPRPRCDRGECTVGGQHVRIEVMTGREDESIRKLQARVARTQPRCRPRDLCGEGLDRRGEQLDGALDKSDGCGAFAMR